MQTSKLMAEIKIKMAKLANTLAKQQEPPKPTKINNIWRCKNNINNRRSNKISLENSLKFFAIYKNLK